MNGLKKTLLILLSVLVSSCTDVIDLDLPIAPPRLVIEASLDWQKGTPGNEQVIKLSLSTPFYDNLEIDPVPGALVKVIRESDGSEVVFEDMNNGLYHTSFFEPVLEEIYILEVIYEGETYIGREQLTPVVPINEIFQSRENGFDKDALEVNVLFTDPEDEVNYYLAKFQRKGDLLPTLFDISDEFTNGNELTIIYEKITDEDSGETEFEPGDVVDIELFGISELYYDYIRLLIQQSGGGGPFSTIPARLKGNCINISDSDNYAFGYFRLTQVDRESYTFN